MGRLGDAHLHPGGQFVGTQARGEGPVAGVCRGELGVDPVQHPQIRGARVGRDRGGRLEVHHRFLGLGTEGDALVVRGQESRGPVDGSTGRQSAGIGQHHEGWQILILGAEAVAQPGAHAGEPVEREAAVHLEGRRSVVVALGEHRVDEAQVVGTAGEVRQQVADPGPALSPLPERIDALHQFPGLPEEPEILAASLQFGAVQPIQFRLVVEGVEVAHAAAAEDLHDALGAGSVVQGRARGRRRDRGPGRGRRGEGAVAGHQPGQGDVPETAHRAGQEMPAIEQGGFSGHRRIRWC